MTNPMGGRIRERRARHHRFHSWPFVMLALVASLIIVAAISMSIGAVRIPLGRLLPAIFHAGDGASFDARARLILFTIRLPRVVMAAMVGALLAASGTVMQGLFRNPLADPGLVGVSAGGALAAAITIVVGDRMLPAFAADLPFVLPTAAFLGALAMTSVLYRIATWQGRTSIAMILLAGLALGALAGAGTGLLVFLADDRQLRDITFWMLGSLAGTTWPKVSAVVPFVVFLLLSCAFVARGLDLMVLGEAEAFHMGIAVERLKRFLIVLIAATAGAAVAVSGVIGFVGIIVPHLMRLVVGPGHRLLLPASAFGGAILLLGADTIARTIVAPAELPIGIVMAVVGAPFFLFLLMRRRIALAL